MLLANAYSIFLPLVIIFNCSIKSGYFPDVWKTSHVIPIPKQNSAYSSPSGFHPISLLSLVSKVFEHHIFNWLLNFCQTNNLISPFQFGFRPSYSAESALIVSTTRWFKLLDQGYSVCSVFFDLEKAVPHRPLLELLSKLNLDPFTTFGLVPELPHFSLTTSCFRGSYFF